LNNLKIQEHKNYIKVDLKKNIIQLTKKENPESILSKLSSNIIDKYIDIAVKSEKIHLFTCSLNEEIIGYAILSDKPKYLTSEFSRLKNDILINLLLKLKFFTIVDIIFSLLKIDIFNIKNSDLNILNENTNLNLIAIKRNFRSQGNGKFFLESIINTFKNKNFSEYLCCETFSKNAENFYIKKLNFVLIGKKIRTTGILNVLKKKL
jgi:hypothetical protein